MKTIKDTFITLALVLAGACLVMMAGVVLRMVCGLFMVGWRGGVL